MDRTFPIPPRRQIRDSHINLASIESDFSSQAVRLATALAPVSDVVDSQITKPLPSTSHWQVPAGEPAAHPIKRQSPWKTHERGYDLKFDQYVTVAIQKAPRTGLVAIKELAKRDVHGDLDRKLEVLSKIRHQRFVDLHEVFQIDDICYLVFDHIFVSLTQVVNCPAYPSERQLVAILHQILEGLRYLSSIGLQHGSLTCSNVLLRPDGQIKLANHECCCEINGLEPSDVRAVGYITMELMQKYANDDGAIGVENLHRWPPNSEPVNFLSMTTSAASIEKLQQHKLLRLPWRKEDLKLLEELASFVRRAYKYHE